MTSHSEDRPPLDRRLEAARLPVSVAVVAPGEVQALEVKREQARAWLASRGIHEPRAVYGASPD
jgi:hypothetical protein